MIDATLEGITNLYKLENEDYMWLEMANFTGNAESFYYFLSLFNDTNSVG